MGEDLENMHKYVLQSDASREERHDEKINNGASCSKCRSIYTSSSILLLILSSYVAHSFMPSHIDISHRLISSPSMHPSFGYLSFRSQHPPCHAMLATLSIQRQQQQQQ